MNIAKYTDPDYQPLIRALMEGKTIQLWWRDRGWTDCAESVEFIFPAERYRVKPGPEELTLSSICEAERRWYVVDNKVYLNKESAKSAHPGRRIIVLKLDTIIL